MSVSVSRTVPAKAGNSHGLRAVKIADRVVQTCMDIVFVIILLLGLWYLADTIYVFNHARASVTMPHKPVDGDIAALQKDLSEDAIGWITLDNTSIDYPVMQGVDNYEYLNKDPYGDYSLAGSIFLDAGNASDFSDEYSIVYGHHMSGGYMFGALDDFAEADYFAEHRTGTLVTTRGEIPVEVICFLYTDASNEMVFSLEKDRSGLEGFLKENAEQYRETPAGRIVALTTCKSPTSTRRGCVFLRLIEEYDLKKEKTGSR